MPTINTIILILCGACRCFALSVSISGLSSAQVASLGQRPQVRHCDVRVAVWHVPAWAAQELAVDALLRGGHSLPVHVGRDDGLGPRAMVRVMRPPSGTAV